MNAFIGTLFNRSEWMKRADKLQNIRSFDGIQLNPTGSTFVIKQTQNKMNNERVLSLFLEKKNKTDNESNVVCYVKISDSKDSYYNVSIDDNELGEHANDIRSALTNTTTTLTPDQENVILQIISNKGYVGRVAPCKYKDMQGSTLLRHLSNDYGHYRFLRPYQSTWDAVASTVSPLFSFCFQVMDAFIMAASTAVMLLVSATLAVRGFVTGDYSGAKKAWDISLNFAAGSLIFALDAVDDLLAGIVAPIPRACATLAKAFNPQGSVETTATNSSLAV